MTTDVAPYSFTLTLEPLQKAEPPRWQPRASMMKILLRSSSSVDRKYKRGYPKPPAPRKPLGGPKAAHGGQVPLTWTWPLPNVWLGTSIEDQQRADERVPALLSAPAALRFLTVEPMLGPVDLARWLPAGHHPSRDGDTRVEPAPPRIGWVIAGAETGMGARPIDLDWVRGVRDQCVAAGVPFLLKQLVEDGKKVPMPELDGRAWAQLPPAAGGQLEL